MVTVVGIDEEENIVPIKSLSRGVNETSEFELTPGFKFAQVCFKNLFFDILLC